MKLPSKRIGFVDALFGRLPDLSRRSVSTALPDSLTVEGRLHRAVLKQSRAHPGKSGIVVLRDGHEAFAARALLADAAEHTLDIQYYIWRNDLSGTFLFNALWRAADRGVRVRLLLDDNNTVGLDDWIAALNGHSNIEVRLFNPFLFRRWRAVAILTDFRRLNRRMHNKSFTADNQVTIIGGRNLGDEYFQANAQFDFIDLDVLAIADVVGDVSRDFDRYWQSDSSYPAEWIVSCKNRKAIERVMAAARKVTHDPAAAAYLHAMAALPLVNDVLADRVAYRWATTHLVSDDPAKALGRAALKGTMLDRLKQILRRPSRELQLVSPYLVPTRDGMHALIALAEEGVDITILTNSLEATDVAAVHAGYAKRRRRLLQTGIKILELMRAAPRRKHGDRLLTGSSGSSLHAKTIAVDRARIFIGSLNLDERSAHLNTEIGFVIESPELAAALAQSLLQQFPERSYRLRLNGHHIEWLQSSQDGDLIHTVEPGTGFWRRLSVSLLALLPIDSLL